MKKFEYKIIMIPTSLLITTKQFENAAKEFEDTLNELGRDGWELIQKSYDGFFYFKREIQ